MQYPKPQFVKIRLLNKITSLACMTQIISRDDRSLNCTALLCNTCAKLFAIAIPTGKYSTAII